MTVYHVDKLYGKNDRVRYVVFPYNFKGTLANYFGIDFKILRFVISYYPWHMRFTGFAKWMKLTRFSKDKAQRLADALAKEAAVLEED